jgi:hypothetical protein
MGGAAKLAQHESKGRSGADIHFHIDTQASRELFIYVYVPWNHCKHSSSCLIYRMRADVICARADNNSIIHDAFAKMMPCRRCLINWHMDRELCTANACEEAPTCAIKPGEFSVGIPSR